MSFDGANIQQFPDIPAVSAEILALRGWEGEKRRAAVRSPWLPVPPSLGSLPHTGSVPLCCDTLSNTCLQNYKFLLTLAQDLAEICYKKLQIGNFSAVDVRKWWGNYNKDPSENAAAERLSGQHRLPPSLLVPLMLSCSAAVAWHSYHHINFPDFGGFNISCYTNLPKPYIQGVYILFRR